MLIAPAFRSKGRNEIFFTITCSARLQPRLRAGCGVALYPTQTSQCDLKRSHYTGGAKWAIPEDDKLGRKTYNGFWYATNSEGF